MNRNSSNLITVLSVLAGVLICGIVVAAGSAARSRHDAQISEYENQAESLSKEGDARIKVLKDENADLTGHLKRATAEGQQQADRLAAANEALLKLRQDLAAALQRVAELKKELAAADSVEVATAETSTDDAATVETQTVAEEPAQVAVGGGGGGGAAVDQAPIVTVVKARPAKGNASKGGKKTKGKKGGGGGGGGGGNRNGSGGGSESSPGLSAQP
jgi:seryl-tRNA synthetase